MNCIRISTPKHTFSQQVEFTPQILMRMAAQCMLGFLSGVELHQMSQGHTLLTPKRKVKKKAQPKLHWFITSQYKCVCKENFKQSRFEEFSLPI